MAEDDLALAERLARAAGACLMDHWRARSTLTVTTKRAGDFVSEADRAAEDLLRAGFAAARPGDGWLGEETGSAAGNGRRWIVDPLDGTTNFLRGIGHWAVSVALEEEGQLILGVMHDPVKDETFAARLGQGATLNGSPIAVAPTADLSAALFGTGIPFGGMAHIDPHAADIARLMSRCAGVRRMGAAALDLAYVAAGRLDGFWERRLQPWDIAAGLVLLREAGATVAGWEPGEAPETHGNVITAPPPCSRALPRSCVAGRPARGPGLNRRRAQAVGPTLSRMPPPMPPRRLTGALACPADALHSLLQMENRSAMPPSSFASTGSATTIPVAPDPGRAPASEALAPQARESLQRLNGDLRAGLPVILQDCGQSALVALVDNVTDARYSAMTALGQAELVLTRRRAEALGARLPIPGDTVQLRIPRGADRDWLTAISGQIGSGSTAASLSMPILQPGTSLHRAAIALAKAIQALPAILAVPLTGHNSPLIGALGLSVMPIALVNEALAEARSQTRVSSALLPMAASAAGRVHVFRSDDGSAEHYAIEIGTPDLSAPVTVRLHSACFTGDVLGSLKCDCGPQLRAAMAAMGAGAGGVLVYLNQEGRGIGLANKMRAYALQETGMDTVEANHWLGFEDDQRDFRVGAQILRRMGIAKVRLMTNNPAKAASLAAQGIAVVDRVPLQVGRTVQNAHYLATKAAKSGHLL